jgi:hypothetical protein
MYKNKYLKYKNKYLELKNKLSGGASSSVIPPNTIAVDIYTIPNSGNVFTAEGKQYRNQCMWISIRDYLNYTNFRGRSNYTVDEIRLIASKNNEFTINTVTEDVNLEPSETEQAKLGVDLNPETTIQSAINRVANYFDLCITIYSLKRDGTGYDSPHILAGDKNSNRVYILATGRHFELITKINDNQLLISDIVKRNQKLYTDDRKEVDLNEFDNENLTINLGSQKDLPPKYKIDDIVILKPGNITLENFTKAKTDKKGLVKIINLLTNERTYFVESIINSKIIIIDVPEDRLELPKFIIGSNPILKPCNIKLKDGQLGKTEINAKVTIINIITDDNGNVLYNARAENGLVIIDIKEINLQY